MKKHDAVQIDTRLSDLFFARRRGDVVEEPEAEQTISNDNSQSLDWLTQFQPAEAPDADMGDTSISVLSTFHVKRSSVRPFWAPEDSKAVRSTWKKSKSILAKDCQKQRKAALRKTSSK